MSNNIQNNYYVFLGTSIAQVQTVFKGEFFFFAFAKFEEIS